MELVVVRHARPGSARGDGPADPSLTDAGRAEAGALAEWLDHADRRPQRIVSSPMRRAHETATVVAEQVGVGVEVDDRLAEFDHGSTEYVPVELLGDDRLRQVTRALNTGVWGSLRFDPAAFRQRVAAAFADVVADRSPERVLVVCHGGVINSYLCDLLQRPYGIFVAPGYTSLTRVHVAVATGESVLRSINELPHLTREGAST